MLRSSHSAFSFTLPLFQLRERISGEIISGNSLLVFERQKWQYAGLVTPTFLNLIYYCSCVSGVLFVNIVINQCLSFSSLLIGWFSSGFWLLTIILDHAELGSCESLKLFSFRRNVAHEDTALDFIFENFQSWIQLNYARHPFWSYYKERAEQI